MFSVLSLLRHSLTYIQGSTPSLFVGTQAFEIIVKQQIKRLEDPSLKCCQLVYDELIRILGQLLAKIVSIVRPRCHISTLTGFTASIQAIPCSSREVQRCGHQLLQDCNEPHYQACRRSRRVSLTFKNAEQET